jgi:hypothetical protein
MSYKVTLVHSSLDCPKQHLWQLATGKADKQAGLKSLCSYTLKTYTGKIYLLPKREVII